MGHGAFLLPRVAQKERMDLLIKTKADKGSACSLFAGGSQFLPATPWQEPHKAVAPRQLL